MKVAGLVLAAGAGVRAGGPKALRREPDGRAWVAIAVSALAEAGCEPVFVVLGAAAEEASALVPASAVVVENPNWAEGMSTSLKAGLAAAGETDADGLLVTLVDLPWQTAEDARAVLAKVDAAAPRAALARAWDGEVPTHPVYLGRAHWVAIAESVYGDAGAAKYTNGAEGR